MGKVKSVMAAGLATVFVTACDLVQFPQDDFADKSYVAAEQSTKEALVSSWFSFGRSNALAIRGWSHFMLGDHYKANAIFKELELRGEKLFEAYLGQAWTLSKLGETEAALAYLDKANGEAGNYNRYLVEDARAWAMLNQGRLDDAAYTFREETGVYGTWQESTPDYLVGLGWVSMRKQEYAEAQNYFEQGLALDPKCHFCRDGLARVALAEQDYPEAMKQAFEGLRFVDYDKGLMSVLETAMANSRDYQAGEQMLLKLAEMHDHVPYYPIRLAQLYRTHNLPEDAKYWYEEALKRDEHNLTAKTGLNDMQVTYADVAVADRPSRQAATRGYQALAAGQYQQAADEFKIALEMEPDLLTAKRGLEAVRWTRYNGAWAALLNNDFVQAQTMLAQASADLPEDEFWRLDATQGWMAYAMEDYVSAREFFAKAKDAGDDPYLAEAGTAMLAIDDGDFEQGASTLARAFVADPLIPNKYCQMAGDKLINFERYAEAYTVLAACFDSQGSPAAIQLRLADLHFRVDDEAMGRLRLFDAMNQAPLLLEERLATMQIPTRSAMAVRSALAWNHYFAKRYPQALANFNAALRYDGADKKALRGRGFVYFKMKDYGRAIADLIQVFDQEPHRLPLVAEYLPIPGTDDQWTVYYNAHTTAAWAALKLNRAGLAAQAFMRAIRDYPELVDAYTGLGYAYMQERQFTEAGRAFDRALELSPSYPDALQGRKLLEQQRGS